MTLSPSTLESTLSPQLAVAGFRRVADHEYRRNGMGLRFERDWLRFESTRAGAAPLDGMLGRPGLWRPVGNGHGEHRRVFDLPARCCAAGDGDDLDYEQAESRAACFGWVTATSRGAAPAGWSPPSAEQVKRHVPEAGLTVTSGAMVRACEIASDETHLAVRCPVLTSLPADLPESRRHWLEHTVGEAQKRWRMVRIGIDDEASAVMAEVDLTGAPPTVLESLLPAAVDSVRCVVRWVAKPAAVIVSEARMETLAGSPDRV